MKIKFNCQYCGKELACNFGEGKILIEECKKYHEREDEENSPRCFSCRQFVYKGETYEKWGHDYCSATCMNGLRPPENILSSL